MVYLFIHQNFPGQYRHIITHLLKNPENRVYFISQPNQNVIPGVVRLVYRREEVAADGCHPHAQEFDHAVRNGLAVARICREMKGQGLSPDVIAGHSAWGETLFVKDEFPSVPILAYFEFYYHYDNVDLGFDPEFPSEPEDAFRLRTRNAINLLSFDTADWGNTPTDWQRSLHPPEMRSRLTRLHEGVNAAIVRPEPEAWLRLASDNLTLTRDHEIVTYVSRNLEPYRGFHVFMRALPEILARRPKAHILIVGGDEVSYGSVLSDGRTYRQMMLEEVGAELDPERVHFLGPVPYDVYLNVLQVSSVHVYLTYPFILSWSFIEALACGCAVIGSATPPVEEVIVDGVNGLLVDFFSATGIAEKIDHILDHPDRMRDMRDAARVSAIDGFDLESRILPAWSDLLDDLIKHRRPRLELPAPQPKRRRSPR